MKTNDTKNKKKLLQDQVLKLLQSKNTNPQGESNADIVRLEKKFDAVLKLMNERMATQLLTKIEKHVMVDNLDKALNEVTKAIEKHKTIIPKSIEVVQNERPKWYKDPLPHPKSIKVDNTVEVKGSVKSDIDWGAFGSVINIAFQGLFEFLNKYAQKTFRIMPAKEHYTTPQMVVITDPKTGRPMSLKDIGANNGNTFVQVSGGKGSSNGTGGGSTDVSALNKETTQLLVKTQIEAVNTELDEHTTQLSGINAELNTQSSLLSSIYDAVNNSQPRNVTKFTVDVTSDQQLISPSGGSRLRIYAIRFTCGGDAELVTFAGSGQPFEQYGNVKSGGMYGQNMIAFHYDLEVDEPLTINVQNLTSGRIYVNVDYEEIA